MKRREKRKDFFHYLKTVIAVLLVLLVLLLSFFGYRFGRALFTDSGVDTAGNGREYVLNISEGESTYAVGSDLAQHGVIDSPLVFLVQSKLFKCKIDPGSYTVNSASSSKAILKYLNGQYEKNRK